MASVSDRINHRRCRCRHWVHPMITVACLLCAKAGLGMSGCRSIVKVALFTGGSFTIGVVCSAGAGQTEEIALPVGVFAPIRGGPPLTTKQLTFVATPPAPFR